jgi:hypothetical protein
MLQQRLRTERRQHAKQRGYMLDLEARCHFHQPNESAVVGIDAREECLSPDVQKEAKRRFVQGDLGGYLELFEPCARFAAYWEISLDLPTLERVRLLANIWLDDPFPHTNLRAWRKELGLCSQHRSAFMLEDELEFLRELPRSVTVYRGAGPEESVPKGLAWALDRDFADMYAHLYCRRGATPGHVFAVDYCPQEAIGYLISMDGREDLVVLPETLKQWRRTPVRPVKAEESQGGTTITRIVDEGSPRDPATWPPAYYRHVLH